MSNPFFKEMIGYGNTVFATPENRTTFSERAIGATILGAQDSFTHSAYSATIKLYAGHSDRKKGLAPIDKDWFDQQGFTFNFIEGETPSQLELRKNYERTKLLASTSSENMHWAGQMAFGMAGSSVMPLDVLTSLVPGGALTKGTRAATQAVLRGKKIGKVYNNLVKAEKLKLPTTRLGAMGVIAKSAAVESAVTEGAIYGLKNYSDQEYTQEDVGLGILFGTAFGAGLGSLYSGKLAAEGRAHRKIMETEHKFREWLSTGNTLQSTKLLFEFDDTFNNGNLQSALNADTEAKASFDFLNERVSDASKAKGTDYDQVSAHSENLRKWLVRNSEAAFAKDLKFFLQEKNLQSDLSMMEVTAKSEEDAQRIHAKLSSEEGILTLTEEEIGAVRTILGLDESYNVRDVVSQLKPDTKASFKGKSGTVYLSETNEPVFVFKDGTERILNPEDKITVRNSILKKERKTRFRKDVTNAASNTRKDRPIIEQVKQDIATKQLEDDKRFDAEMSDLFERKQKKQMDEAAAKQAEDELIDKWVANWESNVHDTLNKIDSGEFENIALSSLEGAAEHVTSRFDHLVSTGKISPERLDEVLDTVSKILDDIEAAIQLRKEVNSVSWGASKKSYADPSKKPHGVALRETVARFFDNMGWEANIRIVNDMPAGQVGAYREGSGLIELSSNISEEDLLPVAIHEFIHLLADGGNRKVYEKLRSVVFSEGNGDLLDKIWTDELKSKYEENHPVRVFMDQWQAKDPATRAAEMESDLLNMEQFFDEEAVAYFVAEASRHPEFWQGLRKKDFALWDAIRDWFVTAWEAMTKGRKVQRSELDEKGRATFRKIGEIMSTIESVDRNPAWDMNNKVGKVHEAMGQQVNAVEENQARLEEMQGRDVRERAKANIAAEAHVQQFTKIAAGLKEGTVSADGKKINLSPEAQAAAWKIQIEQQLEEAGIKGTKQDYVEPLIQYRKTSDYLKSLELMGNSLDYAQLETKMSKNAKAIEDLEDLLWHKANGKTPQEWLLRQKEKALYQLMDKLHDASVRNKFNHRISKDSGENLNYMKTWLDGRNRKGVALNDSSVETKQYEQKRQDASLLMFVIQKHRLNDVFFGTSMGGLKDVLPKKVRSPEQAALHKIYNDNLKDTSRMFWEDLMAYNRSGSAKTLPERWTNADPEVRAMLIEVADAMKDTNLAQFKQMKELGSDVQWMEGHSLVSNRWNDTTMRLMGQKKWYETMDEILDWDRIAKAHGDSMISKKIGKDGIEYLHVSSFDKEEFLDNWWREIVHDEKKPVGRDIAASFDKHRKIFVKPEHEFDALTKFTGHDHVGTLYIDQVRYRSEMIAAAREMGNDALGNLDTIRRRLGVGKGDKIEVTKWKGMTVRNMRELNLQATAEVLLNQLDSPVDAELAGRFKKARQVSNLMFLSGSGISSITDIPSIALVLQQSGVGTSVIDPRFVKAYLKANKRNFKSDPQMREWFSGMGAGADAIANATSRRFDLGDDVSGDILSKANEFMFTINYLNGITQAGQEAFVDVLTQDIAQQLAEGGLNKRSISTLKSFGLTEEHIAGFKDALCVTADGIARFNPDLLTDRVAAKKFREFMTQTMNDAIMVPDAGAKAYVRFGIKDGTLLGGAVRAIFQYMSFPLGVTRSITNRFLRGYDGKLWNTAQATRLQMLSYVGGSLAFGWFATMLKDLSRYKEPITPLNMSFRSASRIVGQSGVLGIMEHLTGLSRLEIGGLVAPLPKTIFQMAGEVGDGDLRGAIRDGTRFTKSVPFAGPPAHWLIGLSMGYGFNQLEP